MVDWISAIWVLWEVVGNAYVQIWVRPLTPPEWINAVAGVLFGLTILFVEYKRRITEAEMQADQRVKHAEEVAEIKLEAAKNHANLSGQIQMSAQINTLLQGATFQHLERITNTTGQPAVTTIAAANTEITELRTELSDFRSMFWRRFTDDEKAALAQKFREIGQYAFRVVSAHPTDCHELAGDIIRTFQSAGWRLVSAPQFFDEHDLDDWDLSHTSGIRIVGKYPADNQPGSKVLDALIPLVRGGLGYVASLQSGDPADVVLFVGPKGARTVLP